MFIVCSGLACAEIYPISDGNMEDLPCNLSLRETADHESLN